MDVTDYHAKYIAHELTRRFPPDSAEKLAGAVAGPQVCGIPLDLAVLDEAHRLRNVCKPPNVRFKPICHCSLRRQVTAYIPFTRRLPPVAERTPEDGYDRSPSDAQDQVDRQREDLIAAIEGKLPPSVGLITRVTARWSLA